MIMHLEILKQNQFGRWALSMALMTSLILVACSEPGKHQGSILREAQNAGVLRVATTNAPTSYFEGRDGLAGFEFDLASAYAAHLELEPKFIVYQTIDAVLEAARNEEVDIVAAGLSQTREREHEFRFGPAYQEAVPVLVCRRGIRKVEDLTDLAGIKVELAAGSSFVDLVLEMRDQDPAVINPIVSENSVEQLLSDVASKRVGCTIADEHVFALYRRYQPSLEARFTIGRTVPLAWVLAGGHGWRNVSLHRDMEHWWKQSETSDLIEQLQIRYFEVAETEFDYVDLSRLRRAIRHKLPGFRQAFEEAEKRYGIPWTLLAAISWRESHWQADATSQTGVRGMMMLTRVTAKEQGVTDRLDAAQSIRGGSRYLASLTRRLPDSIAPDQRTAFGLAAYNMGWGHMTDARELVRQRGGNPDVWAEVSTILPELEQKQVFQTLKHGFGRGREGKAYVAAVLNFADIIEKAYAKPILAEPGTDKPSLAE
jgi:membrane-bound lytic murein transglycosylase F